MGYIHWSYRLADDMLGQILPKLGAKDRLFLVSDHGMEPVHSKLSPNEELKKSGLLVQDRDGKVDVSKSKAFAVSSGSIAHVYINLRGREKAGLSEKMNMKRCGGKLLMFLKKRKLKKAFPTSGLCILWVCRMVGQDCS